MLYSKLFGKTVKQAPADASTTSQKLLHQAGYIRESTSGRYFFLPLGMKVQQNIMKIIKEEMDKTGAQEMVSPILHPLELWKETNRTNTTGFELMKITDRRDFEFALGGTAEEMFVDVIRKFQISYKDLPINIYQFSNKFRDEMRARGGLLRVREFIMKDAYSFDTDEKTFVKTYQEMWKTYQTIFERVGLKTIPVEADNGYIGGEYCHEFDVLCDVGESRFLTTEDGSYAAHEDVAKFVPDKKNVKDKILPLEEVAAVRGTTMEDGVKLHKKPLWLQIKDVLFVDETGRFILSIIRGDYDVNETKLKHVTGTINLRHATEDEIVNTLHSAPGFISPVGIKEIMKKGTKLIIVADKSLRTIVNAYGGANKKHRDLFNMNIDRDYKVDIEADIAMAQDGYIAENGKPLIEKRGIEVGNIFQLGYHYTNLMKNAVFVDKDGVEKKYYMGCYGIGIGRTMATLVEVCHDEKGITWPESVAPYKVHLVGIDLQDSNVLTLTSSVYKTLIDKNINVLYDDREDVRPGEKFADADLLGMPYRVVVSKRTGDNVELKKRTEKETKLMSLDELVAKMLALPKS